MIILGTNSIKDTGYDVANSCRFDRGSSDNLTRTMGTATNVKKFTYSFWIKRSLLSSGSHTAVDLHADADNRFTIFIHPGDDIRFYNINGGSLVLDKRTNAKLRDSSAWYHIVCAVDTTQSTAANRAKIYINGILQDSFGTNTIWDQNYTPNQGTSSYTHNIGRYGEGGDTFSGYMSEVVMIDGLQLGADSFGEFDEDSGIWKPIDVSGLTFGNNGVYLDFENSGALGADVSGNTNNFTVNNLTAIDQSTDTCTNNFATLNPLSQGVAATSRTFSNGNTSVTFGGADDSSLSSIGVSSGKWYAEFKITNDSADPTVGVGNEGSALVTNPGACNIGSSTGAYGYYSNGQKRINGASKASYGDTFTANDIIGVALDLDNGAIYFSKNGTFQASGDPTSGASTTNAAATSLSGTFFFGCCNSASGTTGDAFSVNFGSPPYAISSGNTDGNGYGNFEYAVPSGYYSLNTKNLAEYG